MTGPAFVFLAVVVIVCYLKWLMHVLRIVNADEIVHDHKATNKACLCMNQVLRCHKKDLVVLLHCTKDSLNDVPGSGMVQIENLLLVL